MSRVARPIQAAEVVALSECVDFSQWVRVYLYEVFMGAVNMQALRDADQFPLQTPFRKSDENENSTSYQTSHQCHFCEANNHVNVFKVAGNLKLSMSRDQTTSRCFRSLALTDCSNAYASISAISANSPERSMRILLSYIRDNLLTLFLSFVDACRNLPDLGTKNDGNVGIFKHFC